MEFWNIHRSTLLLPNLCQINQSTSSQLIFKILLLFSHLHVRLPSLCIPLIFLIKTYTFLLPCVLHSSQTFLSSPGRSFNSDLFKENKSKVKTSGDRSSVLISTACEDLERCFHSVISSKVCGRSPAEIVCLNPTGGMDVCLLWMLCCRVEVSASGWSLVQRSPTDCGASIWVWSWILDKEEAMVLVGPQRHVGGIVNPRQWGGLGPLGLFRHGK